MAMALVLLVSACGSEDDEEIAAPAATTVALEGKWRSDASEDPMDGRKTLVAYVFANPGLIDHEGHRLLLVLHVKCELEKTLWVYLSMHDYSNPLSLQPKDFDHASGRESIRVKFEDRNVMRLEEDNASGESTSNFTLINKKDLNVEYPTRLTFDDLVDEILDSETMTVELTPYGAPKQIVTFDLISGLDEYLPEIRQLCE